VRSPSIEIGIQVGRILQPDVLGGGIAMKEPRFEKQRLLVKAPNKRIIVRAGRRGGKTVGASIRALQAFLSGHRVLYAAPVIEQINRFWTEVTEALAEPIDAGIFYKNEGKHLISLRGTEQAITAKTAWNADSLRGDYGDLLIMDEWQLMNEDAWERVGAPMLLDNDGDAVFIYTPPSLHSRSTTKASDPRHASKMFKRAEEDMKKAAEEGRESRWLAISWPSHDNPMISKEALSEITKDMTALSHRQEILAEDTTEVPGSLWKQALIDDTRVDKAPALVRIVVGIDPSGSSTTEAGIIGAGIDVRGHGYVVKDASLLAPTPDRWAAAGVGAYADLGADRIVGERNYGGDMVQSTIRTVDENVSYKDVTATRGKLVRAEPVCAKYEQGLVHHVGEFPELEDEMCSYVPGAKSPNRMDALVWALTDLMLESQALGLIDFLKDGAAQKVLDTMNKTVRATTLLKPMISDEAPTCPECGAVTVIRAAGGELHCNQCGIQWKDRQTKPTDGQGMTRAQYLKTEGRER
jgi:ribosomal protein L37AE/L43A